MTEKELTMLALEIAYTILKEYNNRLHSNLFTSMAATKGRRDCVKAVYNALLIEGFTTKQEAVWTLKKQATIRDVAAELVWSGTYSMTGSPNRQNQAYFTSAVDEVADILFDFIVEKKLGGINA